MNYSIIRLFEKNLSAGDFKDTVFNSDTVSLKNGALSGEYVSPFLTSAFFFKEAIPSLNIKCPSGASFEAEVKFEGDIYISFGSWGKNFAPKILKSELAELNNDYFKLNKPCKKCRFRLKLFASEKGLSPIIKSVNMAFSDQVFEGYRNFLDSPFTLTKEIQVPFKSQFAEDKSFRSNICSVTSVAMIMAYYGTDIPVSSIVPAVYEPFYNMYGLWWRSVQVTCEYGYTSWVQYFKNFKEAERFIAEGIPVAACVSYKENELKKAPRQFSEGHVIVINGFDDKGNVICRDSAGKDLSEGCVTYNREEFAKAWFVNAGGVGYIILP